MVVGGIAALGEFTGNHIEAYHIAGLHREAVGAAVYHHLTLQEGRGDVFVIIVGRDVKAGTLNHHVVAAGVYHKLGAIALGDLEIALSFEDYTAVIVTEAVGIAQRRACVEPYQRAVGQGEAGLAAHR